MKALKILAVIAIGSLLLIAATLHFASIMEIEHRNVCVSNLKQIEEAKAEIVLACPVGGVYTTAVNAKPTCSTHGSAVSRNTQKRVSRSH